MTLYNVTETLVKDAFQTAYAGNSRLKCSCPRCVDDILALALNNLPTHYVASDKGHTYVKAKFFDRQLESDVLRELALAALTVGERPNHDANDTLVRTEGEQV